MEVVWKRVQAGFILAEGLPTTPSSPIAFEPVPSHHTASKSYRPIPAAPALSSAIEARMVDIFLRKSPAAVKMHCPSRILIKGYTIEQWLDPSTLTPARALEFLRGLEDKKPWVKAGDPDGSKLVQMLEWEGKMFGAFSREEVGVLRAWVKGLAGAVTDGAYKKHVGEVPTFVDLRQGVEMSPKNGMEGLKARLIRRARSSLHSNPDFDHRALIETWKTTSTSTQSLLGLMTPPANLDPTKTAILLPLWVLSTSLLEQYPLSSSKLASPLGMIVLRLVRSSLGFGALHQPEDICAGIDDMGHEDDGREMTGVWEIATRLYISCGLTAPNNLLEVIASIDDVRVGEFVEAMLELRTRPYANQAVLLGLSLGFADLYDSSVRDGVMGEDDRAVLERIVGEYRETIREHVESGALQDEWADFAAGYLKVREVVGDFVA